MSWNVQKKKKKITYFYTHGNKMWNSLPIPDPHPQQQSSQSSHLIFCWLKATLIEMYGGFIFSSHLLIPTSSLIRVQKNTGKKSRVSNQNAKLTAEKIEEIKSSNLIDRSLEENQSHHSPIDQDICSAQTQQIKARIFPKEQEKLNT